jgi:hypothetical protein
MAMKRLFLILAAAALIVPAVTAQTIGLQDAIAMSRSQIQSDRQAIVAQTLGLTEQQGQVFWPLYREYRAELDKPLDSLWNLFTTYGANWQSMNNSDATKLLNEYLGIEHDVITIKQKWAKTMNEKLDGVTVARFFQIDNKLDTILRLEGAAEIPLIKKQLP